jgi:hypothetical protein
MNNTLVWRGLESLALALIFAPEPVTTIVGMGLLGYARKKRTEEQLAIRPPARYHSFTDFYTCKVKMMRGSTIAYRASTTREGQLPLIRSTISHLYQNRREWESFSKTVTSKAKPTTPRPPAQRPATPHPTGLKTPFLRYQTGLVPKRGQI